MGNGTWHYDGALKPMAVFDGLLEVSSIPLNSIRVWDKLHKLPPRLHTKNVGRNIGGTFGKFLHVDKGNVPMYKLQSTALDPKPPPSLPTEQ